MTATQEKDLNIRPGMIVRLRRRTWRVENIAGGILTATPLDDFGSRAQQFLLELESPQPGNLAAPSLEYLGDYTLQSLFLQAVRLDALHGTAPFVSIQRTAVIPVEYQLVPLVMALRQQPARLMIADTVGLGKTVEAGLIMSELLARGRARSVLIITPANLREQWRQQMRDLFYQEFEIISSETRKKLERAIPPGADPWLYFDRLIVSIDYAKDVRIRPEILKRKWDIVIVDECHNAAMPHSQHGRKADMDRWEVIRQIAERASEHLLLLSATPHNGYTDSYCSLLSMLSPELVREVNGEIQPERNTAILHVCQRTRNDVQKWFEEAGQSFPFPDREPSAATEVAIDLHRDYFRVLQKLDNVMNFMMLHAQNVGRTQPVEWLRLHMHRRALSSPEALRKSLENRVAKLKAIMDRDVKGESEDSLLASLGDQGASDVETEDDRDRNADAAILTIEQKLQLQYFADLLADLKAIRPTKDKKLIALRDNVIPSLFAKAGGDTPARVIIFTRFKDTLQYLEKELTRGADYDIITLYGDLSQAEREKRFDAFAASKRGVLLATDVISEGINLQTVACMVVHADIPYNPNRLDQRNGRVDRFGQRAPMVYIRTLYCKDTTDEDVLSLLVRKLDQMRRDYGFSPPLFASEETVLRALTRRRKRRSEEPAVSMGSLFEVDEDNLIDETAIQKMKSEGFYGQADVRIRDVSDRLHEVHRRFGSPEQIHRFIQVGLRRYNCSVETKANGTLRIEIKNPRLRVPGIPSILEKVVLDPEERTIHADAVVLDVGYPLVRRLNAVMREDALRQTEEGARTSAHYVKGQRGTWLVGHGLLRATAETDPPTLLEEVVTFGIRAGISGIAPLAQEEAAEAIASQLSSRSVVREQALTILTQLYAKPEWAVAEKQAVANAVANLRAHRAEMKSELEVTESGRSRWLNGFDDVQEVGFDLYCLTLLLPEGI